MGNNDFMFRSRLLLHHISLIAISLVYSFWLAGVWAPVQALTCLTPRQPQTIIICQIDSCVRGFVDGELITPKTAHAYGSCPQFKPSIKNLEPSELEIQAQILRYELSKNVAGDISGVFSVRKRYSDYGYGVDILSREYNPSVYQQQLDANQVEIEIYNQDVRQRFWIGLFVVAIVLLILWSIGIIPWLLSLKFPRLRPFIIWPMVFLILFSLAGSLFGSKLLLHHLNTEGEMRFYAYQRLTGSLSNLILTTQIPILLILIGKYLLRLWRTKIKPILSRRP